MKPRVLQTCKSRLFNNPTAEAYLRRTWPQCRFGQTSEGDGAWLNSLSRVDDAPASLSTTGVSTQQEQHSSPPTRHSQGESPTDSPTHNLLQSLRAELQRHQDAATSLKSERDALNKELDRRKDLETSRFCLAYFLLAVRLTNAWPNQNSKMFKESSNVKQTTEHLWHRMFNTSRASYVL